MKRFIALFFLISTFIYAESSVGFVTQFNKSTFEETNVEMVGMLAGLQVSSFPKPGKTGWMNETSILIPVYIIVDHELSDSRCFNLDNVFGGGTTLSVPVKYGKESYLSFGGGFHTAFDTYFESCGVARELNFGVAFMMNVGNSANSWGISLKVFADLFGWNKYYFSSGGAISYDVTNKFGGSMGIIYRL